MRCSISEMLARSLRLFGAASLTFVEEVMKAGRKDLEFTHGSRFVTPAFLRQLADRLEAAISNRDAKRMAELEK